MDKKIIGQMTNEELLQSELNDFKTELSDTKIQLEKLIQDKNDLVVENQKLKNEANVRERRIEHLTNMLDNALQKASVANKVEIPKQSELKQKFDIKDLNINDIYKAKK